MNDKKAAARRLEYYRKKDAKKHAVHLVLADFCRQADAPVSSVDDDVDDEDDVAIFLSAMAGSRCNEEDGATADNSESSADDPKLFVMKCTWDSPISKSFEGAFVVSGAQKTVIGVSQAIAYCDLVNEALKNDEDTEKLIYTFGSHQHKGIVHVNI